MRIFVLTAAYELRVSRKSHLRDHPMRKVIESCGTNLAHATASAAILAGSCRTGVSEYRANLARVACCTLTDEAGRGGDAGGAILAGGGGAGADRHPGGGGRHWSQRGHRTPWLTAVWPYTRSAVPRGAEALHNA
jgi:hypothetical protein